MANKMTTAEAREHFAELVNKTAYGKERTLLTRRGKNIAAVVPLDDLLLLQTIEERLDVVDAAIALKEAKNVGTTSLQKVKKELGL